MTLSLDLTNIEDYIQLHVLPLFPDSTVADISEITEHTYVNWIYRVELRSRIEQNQVVYLRQSRDRVKTRPDIPVDPKRVGFEVQILELIGSIIADTVPAVLFYDDANNISVLTDVRQGAPLLVNELLAGRTHQASGKDFGRKMGTIHGATLGISDVRVRGDKKSNDEAIAFHLGMRLGPAREAFPSETTNLIADGQHGICTLVCGDFASKNIFVDNDTIRFLDLERSWRGDPAFDPAFLFSHFLLEVPPVNVDDALAFIEEFMKSYNSILADYVTKEALAELQNRIVRYVGVCILYRIDGLYLVVDAKEDKDVWRDRAAALIRDTEISSVKEAIAAALKS
ncbi:MAG: hypothetical protein PGN37_01090 [Mycobacterium kyogaense]|uniref:hypothetical protein n=1 Tax=Mycobacterium kyogaense TaxID=2212479 RepID=UPI002FF7229F